MDETNHREKVQGDNTFKAHKRREKGGQFSAEALQVEQPGEKRHGSEVGDIFKKKRTADCIEH